MLIESGIDFWEKWDLWGAASGVQSPALSICSCAPLSQVTTSGRRLGPLNRNGSCHASISRAWTWIDQGQCATHNMCTVHPPCTLSFCWLLMHLFTLSLRAAIITCSVYKLSFLLITQQKAHIGSPSLDFIGGFTACVASQRSFWSNRCPASDKEHLFHAMLWWRALFLQNVPCV